MCITNIPDPHHPNLHINVGTRVDEQFDDVEFAIPHRVNERRRETLVYL